MAVHSLDCSEADILAPYVEYRNTVLQERKMILTTLFMFLVHLIQPVHRAIHYTHIPSAVGPQGEEGGINI